MPVVEIAFVHLVPRTISGSQAKFPLDFRNTLLYCWGMVLIGVCDKGIPTITKQH
jgi:hypothetical protein